MIDPPYDRPGSHLELFFEDSICVQYFRCVDGGVNHLLCSTLGLEFVKRGLKREKEKTKYKTY